MLVFVDCEAYGGCPATGKLTEFGAVVYPRLPSGRWATLHGVLVRSHPSRANPAIPEPDLASGRPAFPVITTVGDGALGGGYRSEVATCAGEVELWERFQEWLLPGGRGPRPVFVSDNPAFDWQWVNDGFWRALGHNPFGHSARRIGDFYAGLCGDFHKTQEWKRFRRTKHDHNPVHDAIGNAEAFEEIVKLAESRKVG